jgi:hypothetical protein
MNFVRRCGSPRIQRAFEVNLRLHWRRAWVGALTDGKTGTYGEFQGLFMATGLPIAVASSGIWKKEAGPNGVQGLRKEIEGGAKYGTPRRF